MYYVPVYYVCVCIYDASVAILAQGLQPKNQAFFLSLLAFRMVEREEKRKKVVQRA